MIKRLLLFATVGALLVSCAFDGRMTPQVVALSGTQTFDRGYNEAYHAALIALHAEGYATTAEPDTGIIRTIPTVIAYGTRVGPPVTRMVVVRVRRAGSATVVSAQPYVFSGNTDISEDFRWDIDNPEGGEHRRWRRFFADMRKVLHIAPIEDPKPRTEGDPEAD